MRASRWLGTKPRKVLLVGYGSIGQALTPVLLEHFGLAPRQVGAIAADDDGRTIADACDIAYINCPLTRENHRSILSSRLAPGDWLINVSVEVSSLALIAWCQENGILYLDTCIEPWAGGYRARADELEATTNYALRQAALSLHRPEAPTAIVAHGANPGLISHLTKAGLLELARIKAVIPRGTWGEIARALGIAAIHIAELDTQFATGSDGSFVNTWSVDGLLSEAWQCAEMGWGTHERSLPPGSHAHDFGGRAGIYLDRHSATVKVKSWVPAVGEQSAYLITHHEALSIAELLTVPGHTPDRPHYRPTVYYAYRPSPATCSALDAWAGGGFEEVARKAVLRDTLEGGFDQLGVLFVFAGGAYWYGSTLSLAEARRIAPHNNATSLQVVAGILGALDWMSRHPSSGVVEAESIDHPEVLAVARPYLGEVAGVRTDWQPGEPGDLQFDTFRVSSNKETALT